LWNVPGGTSLGCNPLHKEYDNEAGLAVDVAGDGEIALRMAQAGLYDIILMDMQMPVMDGVTATREIRRLAPQSAVPIVAMTTNVMQEDRQRCFEAGMNDFVSKPIDPDELVAVLLKWITPGQARHRHEPNRATVPAKGLD
jgi:two-component system sensor histidine kinase/response regulator